MSDATKTLEVIPIVDRTPAKRCSDFDEDCAYVPDHYLCWTGGGCLDQADGYCPYLIGQA